jgi:hypothetical protein
VGGGADADADADAVTCTARANPLAEGAAGSALDESVSDGDTAREVVGAAHVPLCSALPAALAVADDALADALESSLELALASADALCAPAVSDTQPLAEGEPDAVSDAALERAAVALALGEPVRDTCAVIVDEPEADALDADALRDD